MPKHTPLFRRFLIAGLVFIAVLLALVAWAVIEPRTLWVERAIVYSPRLPEDLEGLRIAFVSDIHTGELLGGGHANNAIRTVGNLHPDLVILGGDFVDDEAVARESLYPALASLKAPSGRIAVLGNHDSAKVAAQLEQAGFVVLDNDRARARFGAGHVRVAGVEDLDTGEPDFAQATRDIGVDEFVIAVSHNPDAFVEQVDEAVHPIDLMLAGHTHGGQVTVFGLWAPWAPTAYGKQTSGGWARVGDAPLLVTRGVGVYRLPVRFFAPPQVHMIELRKGPARVAR